ITNRLYINNRRRNYLDIELHAVGNDSQWGPLRKTVQAAGVSNRIGSDQRTAVNLSNGADSLDWRCGL
ncbi:MAG: hypothetical protein WCH75_01365, partial [Candidatus Binatia bacterium]